MHCDAALILSACALFVPQSLVESISFQSHSLVWDVSTSPVLGAGSTREKGKLRRGRPRAGLFYVVFGVGTWAFFLSASACGGSAPARSLPVQVPLSWLLQLADPVAMGTRRAEGEGRALPSAAGPAPAPRALLPARLASALLPLPPSRLRQSGEEPRSPAMCVLEAPSQVPGHGCEVRGREAGSACPPPSSSRRPGPRASLLLLLPPSPALHAAGDSSSQTRCRATRTRGGRGGGGGGRGVLLFIAPGKMLQLGERSLATPRTLRMPELQLGLEGKGSVGQEEGAVASNEGPRGGILGSQAGPNSSWPGLCSLGKKTVVNDPGNATALFFDLKWPYCRMLLPGDQECISYTTEGCENRETDLLLLLSRRLRY
ncbi:Hypothetical predicted protein [Podarcis lilfordi]|uniref:Uncharacterized protein n=1 Tax=Podarcis lilfordi TaxID=74358 RepID=A0AA35KJV9_9SAUR|nr:Hypothetical predicted protein [Podarcis lilfordi]